MIQHLPRITMYYVLYLASMYTSHPASLNHTRKGLNIYNTQPRPLQTPPLARPPLRIPIPTYKPNLSNPRPTLRARLHMHRPREQPRIPNRHHLLLGAAGPRERCNARVLDLPQLLRQRRHVRARGRGCAGDSGCHWDGQEAVLIVAPCWERQRWGEYE